eukprot:TRINITY_DN40111_c0_g1_i1.p1 TRINITY_DN40111_c0_g1~~TRINITY_DN40111_c0_g1_i1.p1  ORF type:complete len:728 (+),score=96.32 TRINITY_DN40111_c0_g1_i1:318-2186(+)
MELIGPDGRKGVVHVPPGITSGQAFEALVAIGGPSAQQSQARMPPAPAGALLSDIELEPWLEAARNFRTNEDFLLRPDRLPDDQGLRALMDVMRAESDGKLTIQALGDKLILGQLLDNLRVSQMPRLLEISDKSEAPTLIKRFVEERMESGEASEVILKPSHLSNSEGVLTIGVVRAEQLEATVNLLEEHVIKFLDKRACDYESAALRSLRPGFLVQPKYESAIAFGLPLELRVVALWGKVRTAIWWWSTQLPRRNVWIVRRKSNTSKEHDGLLDDGEWEALHQHPGQNVGFDAALDLFVRCMPEIAAVTEHVATAVGAPFLRADFFMGSQTWGLRLNEVAYGSGLEHRRRADEDGTTDLVDDGPVVAQILREGMSVCSKSAPSEAFLSQLGVLGDKYEELQVRALSERACDELAAPKLQRLEITSPSVPPELCRTPRSGSESSAGAPGWMSVLVPAGVRPGGLVHFMGGGGESLIAKVPAGIESGSSFPVQVVNGLVYQPCQIDVPEGKVAGDQLLVIGLDGGQGTVVIPADWSPGHALTVMLPAPPAPVGPVRPPRAESLDYEFPKINKLFDSVTSWISERFSFTQSCSKSMEMSRTPFRVNAERPREHSAQQSSRVRAA